MPANQLIAAAVVLLVQAEDDSREMYAEYLRHYGVQVLCAADVNEAMTLAPTADCIVTGLLLPGTTDGYEFIRRLRNDERTRQKPIIVVTSWAWQTERLRALEAGCDVFLTKPCLPNVLLRQIQKSLASARPREVRDRRRRPTTNQPADKRNPKGSA